MITIYSSTDSPRLHYTLKLIFGEVLGMEYKLTSDQDTLQNASGIKINYSSSKIAGCLHIQADGLLSENTIHPHDIAIGNWEGLTTLYANETAEIPFDLFAAAFYLASRYEEYLPFNADVHGRFEAQESIAHKQGFLKLPIIDLWCKKLAEKLDIYPLCKNIQSANYQFQLTVDIDQAWAYKNKGVIYALGSPVLELVRFNLIGFTNRLLTLFRIKADPADAYAYLTALQEQLKTPILYFIQCRNSGKYDKNASLNHKAFHRLIKDLDQASSVGIHPSYSSNIQDGFLKNEIAFLNNILKHSVSMSRQHYLKLKFPDTFQTLIEQGITNDFSLGYSASTGFRSGLARSYNFYDLRQEKETGLRLTPLHIMDRTLLDYQQNSPEEAMGEYAYYTELVRSVGGELVCLWHNESLGNIGEWKGWKQVFEEMIKLNTTA